MMHADSRLDSGVVAGPGATLRLRMTLLKISNLKSEDGRVLDADVLRRTYRRMFVNAQCANPDARRLYKAGVVVVVAISDRNGDPVTKLSTSEHDCGLF